MPGGLHCSVVGVVSLGAMVGLGLRQPRGGPSQNPLGGVRPFTAVEDVACGGAGAEYGALFP